MEKQLGAIIWSVDRVKGADLGVLAFFQVLFARYDDGRPFGWAVFHSNSSGLTLGVLVG